MGPSALAAMEQPDSRALAIRPKSGAWLKGGWVRWQTTLAVVLAGEVNSFCVSERD